MNCKISEAASAAQFEKMCALYREWNEKINVVSRKDIDNLYEHHILHSLAIAMYLEGRCPQTFLRWKSGGVRVLDLGCGGGFPGIPLATVFPDVEFTLCDSIGKKITVAQSVAQSLGLSNVRCVNSRVEQLDGQWDHVVSRAVAPLDRLLSWVRGKYGEGIICLKGGDISEEIDDCRRMLGKEMPPVDVWNIYPHINDGFFKEKLVVNLGNFQK